MRAIILLTFMLWPSLQTASAQERTSWFVPVLVETPLPAPTTVDTVVNAAGLFVLAHPHEYKLDRGTGALYGLGIGALAGGVGFAGLNYLFTTSIPRDEYTRLALFVGAVAGGSVGVIVGAILGVSVRKEAQPHQARLRISPEVLDGRGTAISLSFVLQ